MSAWRLFSYEITAMSDAYGKTAHYVAPSDGKGGYSVKLLRDIHRALLSLSDEDYAEVRKLLEGEEELYE